MSRPGFSRQGPSAPNAESEQYTSRGVQRDEPGIVDLEPLGDATAISLDDNIGAGDEPREDLASLGGAEIERDALLVAVHGEKDDAVAGEQGIVHGARGVAGRRLLDLHDVRAHVGEVHPAHRPRDEMGELEDAVPGER